MQRTMKNQKVRYGNNAVNIQDACNVTVSLSLSKKLVRHTDLQRRTSCKYFEVTMMLLRLVDLTILKSTM